MSSQLQDKEEATEIKGKSRFYNPFTGKDPFEEDIKKGLSIEEMKKRLQERSAQEKIKYLESLLSKRGSSLKKGTVHGIEEIITESYKFFGDEMMKEGHYEEAAGAYANANEDELAKKAWKLEGDAQMAAAQAESVPEEEETQAGASPKESKHGETGMAGSESQEETKKEEPKPAESGHGEAGRAGSEEETGKEEHRPGNEKTEGAKKKTGKGKETNEKISLHETGALAAEEGRKTGKEETGKKRKSGFEAAAEAYENAGEDEMAKAAWKLAGEEYLSFSESDRRCLDDALGSYKKGGNFRMAVHVSLLAGKNLKSIEELAKKGNLTKKDFVVMGKDFLTRDYLHAARFLFNLAGEKDLASKVAEMEKKK
jgi:hypothetical protein